MKSLLLMLGLVLAAIFMVPISVYAQITVFDNDWSGWNAAVEGTYLIEDFDDATLNYELSVVSTYPGFINAGVWWDRLTFSSFPATTTTWEFAIPIYAYGGTWNLSEPGGPGSNIEAFINGTWVSVGVIDRSYINIFWGFVSEVPFTQVRLQAYNNQGTQETYELDNMVYSALDKIPPSCERTHVGTNGEGKTFIEITTEDDESGLSDIIVTQAVNATVTGYIAGSDFSVGTTNPVIVTATKNDQSQSSFVELEVTDVAGNVTVCDPVITLVVRENGQPVSETYTNIPEAESNITVENGDPGLKNLEIIVNGDKYKVTGLKDGDVLDLDVSDSMVEGNNNTMTLTAKGKPGASATVVISDF